MNNNQSFIYTNKKSPAPVRGSDVIIAQLLSLLLSLFLPIALFMNISDSLLQTLSILSGVASVIIIAKLTRSTRTAISFSLFLVAAFTLLGAVLCGVVAAVAGSVCVLAYTLIKADKVFLRLAALTPAIIAYLGAAAILGSFIFSLPALLHLPIAATLAYCFAKRVGRVSTICRTSAVMIIMALAPVVIYFLKKYGTDLSMISTAVESAKSALSKLLTDSLYSLYSQMPELENSMSMTDATELSTYAVTSLFNLLPAIIVISFNLIAFAFQSMLTSVLVHGETDKEKIVDMVAFDMSTVSAAVFIISLFITLILSAEDISVWSVTAENIALILMPGLLFTAFAALRAFVFTKRASCFMVLLYLGSILMIFYSPTIMIPLASFAGAVLIILNSITRFRLKRKK